VHYVSRVSLTGCHGITIKGSKLLKSLFGSADPVEPPFPRHRCQLSAKVILFLSLEVLSTHSEIRILTHPFIRELKKEVFDRSGRGRFRPPSAGTLDAQQNEDG
jgi:hypothetical protein